MTDPLLELAVSSVLVLGISKVNRRFLKVQAPIRIDSGAGLFLIASRRQQFILPAQDLDVVQIWPSVLPFGDILSLQRDCLQFFAVCSLIRAPVDLLVLPTLTLSTWDVVKNTRLILNFSRVLGRNKNWT